MVVFVTKSCIALWVKARFKISFWNFVSHFIHIPIFQTEFLAMLLCYFASKYSRAAMKIFLNKTVGGIGVEFDHMNIQTKR